MRHLIKIKDEYYQRIITGDKRFEIRFNDRDYQIGDELKFLTPSTLSKRSGLWRIIYIHSGFGMAENYVILGIEPMEEKND